MTVLSNKTHKTCPTCKESKTIAKFHDHPEGKYGKQTYCKTCSLKRGIKYRTKYIRGPNDEPGKIRICHGIHCRGNKSFMSYGRRYCRECLNTIQGMEDGYSHNLKGTGRTAKRL